MEKIICDICGTTYPSSADSCPICGCSNSDAADLLEADVSFEELLEETEADVQATPERKKKGIFDFDEVNQDEDPLDADDDEEEDDAYDEDEEEDDDEEEERPSHNTFVVILLTILIVALLGAAGFIFVRYFLPNMKPEETVPVTEAVQVETDAATTEPVVPCQHMAMTNAGVAELSAEGQQFLLHIKALPEDTTDRIIYTSGDESIATVTEDGKITAVSEGETTIYISCGIQRIECPVIVKYVEETVPPTTEAVEEETTAPADEETVSEETVAEDASDAKDDSGLKNVKLKLKRTDIQLGVYYSFRLELDCDLDPTEVTWTSEHPHIAKVDENGSVTAVKAGTTSVTAKYGDQEVKCMVRCIWY